MEIASSRDGKPQRARHAQVHRRFKREIGLVYGLNAVEAKALQPCETVGKKPCVGCPEPRMRHHGRSVRSVYHINRLRLRRTVTRDISHRLRSDETVERVLHAFREALIDEDARDVRTRHDLASGIAAYFVHCYWHAQRREAFHHPDIALLPSRADSFEEFGERRRIWIDAEPQHVELTVPLAGIDRQLDARKSQAIYFQLSAGVEETRTAIRAVMVGKRHHREGTAKLGQFLWRTGAVRRRAVDMQVDHFFTISVIAWRNSLTSAKRR